MNILAVNCMLDDQLISDFDQALARIIRETTHGVDSTTRRLTDMSNVDRDVEKYTHLILSGSEASVLDENPWDENLTRLITAFVNSGLCVLGICYGHQFIVRALVGRGHLRKRSRRVWGWLPISIKNNSLFKGIAEPVFLTVNSDEVFDLPTEFKILASVDHCQVMAYQYAGHPTWGVQFHSEYNLSEGHKVIEVIARTAKPDSYTLTTGVCEDSKLSQNLTLFSNFFRAVPFRNA